MTRALLAAVFLALVAVPAASANGDPASDVLLTSKVFVSCLFFSIMRMSPASTTGRVSPMSRRSGAGIRFTSVP